MGDIQPPLRDVIQSGEIDFPQKGCALVPGCGRVRYSVPSCSILHRSYITLYISRDTMPSFWRQPLVWIPWLSISRRLQSKPLTSKNLSTLFIDASYSLPRTTNSNLASLSHPPTAKVSFEKTDFFSFKVPDTERFDLIYDYTYVRSHTRVLWFPSRRFFLLQFFRGYPPYPSHGMGPSDGRFNQAWRLSHNLGLPS